MASEILKRNILRNYAPVVKIVEAGAYLSRISVV